MSRSFTFNKRVAGHGRNSTLVVHVTAHLDVALVSQLTLQLDEDKMR